MLTYFGAASWCQTEFVLYQKIIFKKKKKNKIPSICTIRVH